MASSSNILKARNAPIIWGVLVADGLFLLLSFYEFDPDKVDMRMAFLRLILSTAAPVVALLLSHVLSDAMKASLVFWRFRHALPGHRAFSKYAPRDPRIDLKRLTQNIAVPIPSAAAEQNALWYRLFRKVESDPGVENGHKNFLLYRELAAVSFLIALGVAALWSLRYLPQAGAVSSIALFGGQYLLCAMSARHAGQRFVCTVLAVHTLD